MYFVYRNGSLIYIGKALNFAARWRSHHKLADGEILETDDIEWKQYDASEVEFREIEWIAKLRPPLNHITKESKSRAKKNTKLHLRFNGS